MRMGRLITEVNMPVEAIESEIGAAYLRLATSAGTARYRQRHYLDGQTAGTLFGTVTALTAAYPWALDDFGAPAWAAYQPDPQAPPPDGLRVGMLRIGEDLPPMPAVARFAGHGNQTGHGAVRARRPGGPGPAPERVPAPARAHAGGQ